MRKITITKANSCTDIGDQNPELTGFEIEGPDEMQSSDGSHTFDELYEHRNVLFIQFCHALVVMFSDPEDADIPIWRSKMHSDNTFFDGYFILGIFKEHGKQVTYHLPMSKWDETDFAETLDLAPEYDGHTPNDVLNRLKLI